MLHIHTTLGSHIHVDEGGGDGGQVEQISI